MNIIVACECSDIVADAFKKLGHNAHSCDLKPSEHNRPDHYQCDMRLLDYSGIDLLIAHPDCTHLAVSGARWWKDRAKEQWEAIEFVRWIANLPVPRIAIENPIGILSTVWRKPDQIIQPWMFGHGEVKATCLWLKGLLKLVPTNIVDGREQKVWRMPPSEHRKADRARTYQGIANAMAAQWEVKEVS
jgi:site-specific DNA-cytosine methylase